MYVVLILVVLVFFLARRGFENAGAIFVGIYTLSAISGYLGFRVFSFAYGMPFQFGDSLSTAQFVVAEKAFLVALLAFSIGYMSSSKKPRTVSNQSRTRILRKRTPGKISKKSLVAFCGFVLSISLLIVAYGGFGLFAREEYLPETIDRVFKSLGILLTPAVLIYAHYFKVPRTMLFTFYATFLLLFFGMGSRSLVLLPVSYLLASFVSSKNEIGIKKLVISGVAALACISIALTVRQASTHGIFPYAVHLRSGGLPTDILLLAFNYGTAFSYSITAYLLDSMNYNLSYFWTSIDPRLGWMVGWPEISKELKINIHAPYNTISELFYIGWPVAGTYYFLVGAFFAYCERISSARSRLLHFAVYISVLFFTIYSLQYNLRSATRIVYYMLALLVAYTGVLAVLFLLKSTNRNSAGLSKWSKES